MRWFLRLFRWSLNLIFAGLLSILGLSLFAPSFLDLDFRAVASGSMEPRIPMGSVVVIQPTEVASIQPGEVITFRSTETPGVVVTHRVVEVLSRRDGVFFRTQGDANDTPDLTPVPGDNLLGRVRFHLPYLGLLSQFVRTQKGWVLIVLFPAGTIILMEIVNILKLIWSTSDQAGPRKPK